MSKEPGYLAELRQMETKAGLLSCMLEATVPLRMLELRQQGGPTQTDWDEARAFGDRLGPEGDNLLFRGHKRGQTAGLAASLIRVLAVAAFAPGGITFAGTHYDAGMPDATGDRRSVSPAWLQAHWSGQ